ncbi:MAG: branched-chain amino acid ABC transporter permease [Aggregatilineales bacterium]
MSAALIIGLIVAPLVIGGGLRLWRRAQAANVKAAVAHANGASRPAWLGYLLVGGSVVVAGLVIAVLQGTALYQSFGGFPIFVIGLIVGVLCACTAGVLLGIPVLRLRGDYLAIVTLGFGEIIRLFLNNLKDITGGPQGLLNIPHAAVGNVEMGSNEGLLYLTLIGCLLVAMLSLRLKSSRLGRAWGALNSDEDIAQAMGINITNTKVLAFAIGAAFAGIAGVIFAARQGSIFPENFTLDQSINVLSLIIIGGMGSIPGVIVGALVLIGVPESLRVFENYRILAFGALLITMMIVRPRGLLPQPPTLLESRAQGLKAKSPEQESVA